MTPISVSAYVLRQNTRLIMRLHSVGHPRLASVERRILRKGRPHLWALYR